MERITRRAKDGRVFVPECITGCDGEGSSDRCNNCNVESEMINTLADYEDAEEQGLLLRLPCPIGTTVYVIEEEWEEIYEPSSKYYFVRPEKFDVSMLEIFGKDVFLTKEEAEQALKQMGE